MSIRRPTMKGIKKKANAKIVITVEVILIVSMSFLFYCLEMDRSIINAMFTAGSLIVIMPSLFFCILSNRSKKDFLFYTGEIMFLGSYGCLFRELISIRAFVFLVAASFCIAVFPLSLTRLCRRDTNSEK